MDEVHRGAMPSSFRKEKLDDELDYTNSCLLFFFLQFLLFSCQYSKISDGKGLKEGIILCPYLLKITRKGPL